MTIPRLVYHVRNLKSMADNVRRRFKIYRLELHFEPVNDVFLATDPNGLEWHLPYQNPDKYFQSVRFISGEAEDRFFSYLESGDIVLIIGAGTGADTIPFARQVGATGEVYSAEADEHTYECLERNVDLYDLDNTNAYQVAFSDEEVASKSFYRHSFNHYPQQLEQSDADYSHPAYDPVDVPSTTVDAFCEDNRIESIDLLSLTVNGHELDVLHGASNMLDSTRYVMSPDGSEKREEAMELLQENGFTLVDSQQSHNGQTTFFLFRKSD